MEKKVKTLQKSLTKLVKSSSDSEEETLTVLNRPAKLWKCFPVLVLYCCDILKTNDISTALHGSTVFCPCVRYLSTVPDFRHLQCRVSRNLEQTKVVEIYTKEKVKEAKNRMKKVFEVNTKRSCSAENKRWNVLCCPAGSFFLSNVVRFQAMRACICYSCLNRCIICTLKFRSW